MASKKDLPEEAMTVELELADGKVVNCEVLTILPVDGKNYIALLPFSGDIPDSDDDFDEDEEEVWFYELLGDAYDMSKEPELADIEDDETYEKVTDAFDEFLDSEEFEEWYGDRDQ